MAGDDAKPWKQKQKKTQSAPKSIEIFEGKPTVSNCPSLPSTQPDGYIRILCREDAEFFIPKKVVEQLKCVDVILHGEVQFKEKLENVINFPDFRPEVLESVMRFVFIEYVDSLKAEQYWGENAPRVTFQFEVEPGQVMELVYAAHFFGIRNLLNVAASMIAHHLQDVPDVSSMPADLAWCIAEQLSPQDLFYAEEREDFLSLKLDTSSLWERHCKKLLRDDSCILLSSLENYPPYDKWSVSEGPPPTSWKSLFTSIHLQQLADRQDGGSNDALLEEVASKGKWAHRHTIHTTFWNWVMTGPGSLSLEVYASNFLNLVSLSLAKIPLGDSSLLVGNILHVMHLLQLLDISETGFTKDAAINFSKSLQTHKWLQVLRAAYNGIGTEGYAAIARALRFARSVKVLDVRENGISLGIPEYAIESLRSSALQELLLDGNCKRGPSSRRLEDVPIALLSSLPPLLKCLLLEQCELSDRHVLLLANALKGHAAIQRIELGDNKITAHGASELMRWLQKNTSLIELSLAHNNVTDACSPVLSVALQNHPSLEKFSLMGNYSYGEDNLQEVIHAAVERGNSLFASKQKKFLLDLRSTDVSYANRGRIQRQAVNYTSLILLI